MKKSVLRIFVAGLTIISCVEVFGQTYVIPPNNGASTATTYIGTGGSSGTNPLNIASRTGTDIVFSSGTPSTANEKVRIKSNGNVGIGTNPTAKLHVNGNGIFTSSLALGQSSSAPTGVMLQVNGKSVLKDKISINGPAPQDGDPNEQSIPNDALVTIWSGDLRIVETTNYDKMPDGYGADIILQDKKGGVLNIYQGDSVGKIDVSSHSLRIGQTFFPATSTTIYPNGKIAIGAKADGSPLATPEGYRLYVAQGILTEKVKIAVSADAVNWADYVFENDYKLQNLKEVEHFIKENKHLPDVPSAKEVYANGINVAQMDATLLRKIEELTLHMIQLQKQNEKLAEEVAQLKK